MKWKKRPPQSRSQPKTGTPCLCLVLAYCLSFWCSCFQGGVKPTDSKPNFVVLTKLAIFFIALAVVWHKDVYEYVWNIPLTYLFGKNFAADFKYRTTLDRFSSWAGVVVGVFWPSLLGVFGFKDLKVSPEPEQARNHPKITVLGSTLSLSGLLLGFTLPKKK